MRLCYITRSILRILVMEKLTLSRNEVMAELYYTCEYENVCVSKDKAKRLISSEKLTAADPFVHVYITCIMTASHSHVT
jgi:hypothetical protein